MGVFDRILFNRREKLLSGDLNGDQSRRAEMMAELVRRWFGNSTLVGGGDGYTVASDPEGFFGSGFAVKWSSALVVTVTPGVGFARVSGTDETAIYGADNARDTLYRPVEIAVSLPITLDAAPTAGQNRIDIIEAAPTRVVTQESRQRWNTVSRRYAPENLNKNVSYGVTAYGRVVNAASSAPLSYKVGVAATAGTEVAPATTSGYQKIAEVLVEGGATAITQAKVADFRKVLVPGGVAGGGMRCRLWTPATSGTAPLLRAYFAPAGIRATIAHDMTTAVNSETEGYILVAHGPGQQAVVTASAKAVNDGPLLVNFRSVGTVQVLTQQNDFNGVTASWLATPPMQLAKAQWVSAFWYKVTRAAGGAFTEAPELLVTYTVGSV